VSPTPLRLAEIAPVPEVVEMLEQALARARSGEIRGIGLAMACAGNADMTALCTGDMSIATLVLANRRLELRLLAIGEDG